VLGLILAGGDGSRLAADGVVAPKALAEVGGRPQLLALAERFLALGCSEVACLLRADVLPLAEPLLASLGTASVRLVPCRTPSSLHTLVEGLAALPAGDVFCSMVDSVMTPADWSRVFATAARDLATGADAVLAVTPPADDDAPLWVQLGAERAVSRVGGGPSEPPRVTGGVYAFAPAARARAAAACAAGRHRMRAFLAELVDAGATVRAVDVARIIDVDHRRDLDAANAYLAGTLRTP